MGAESGVCWPCLAEVSLADRKICPLTDRRGPDTSPAVSPDGRHIAYIAKGRFASDLQVMKPDGTGGKTFSEDGTDEEAFGNGNDAPAWGPAPR